MCERKYMKTLKFKHHLAIDIVEGRKTVTWRLFDDKDLRVGDKLEFFDGDLEEKFAEAELIRVYERKMKDVGEEELCGHEKFESREKMLETYKKYYGERVDWNTIVKIIKFRILKKVVSQ